MPDDTNSWTGTMGEKPLIEQELFKLQDDWYAAKTPEDRDAKWSEMLDKLSTYSSSIIKEKLSNKKYLPPEEIASMAYVAACEFMNQYIYKRNYKTQASFYGLLEPRIRGIMYGPKHDDHCYSLDTCIGDSEKNLGDLQVVLKFRPIFQQELTAEESIGLDIHNVYNLIDEILADFDYNVDNDYISIKARLFLALLLKKPDMDKKSKFFSKCTPTERELFELLEKELVNRLRANSDLSSVEFEDPETDESGNPIYTDNLPKVKRGRKKKGTFTDEEEEEDAVPELYQL